jgi:hypothetical protein
MKPLGTVRDNRHLSIIEVVMVHELMGKNGRIVRSLFKVRVPAIQVIMSRKYPQAPEDGVHIAELDDDPPDRHLSHPRSILLALSGSSNRNSTHELCRLHSVHYSSRVFLDPAVAQVEGSNGSSHDHLRGLGM